MPRNQKKTLQQVRSERAQKAWKTRIANAKAAGAIDGTGRPSRAEARRRSAIAKRAWVTRRAIYGPSGMAS